MENKTSIANYVKLHFIVFIWGFTGVLGKLISIDGAPLACVRMFVALIGLLIYMLFAKVSFNVDRKTLYKFVGIGLIIAAHWATFFIAIKVSNVSVALVCMSASALFMSFLEPIILKRKIDRFEILFGLIVIAAILLIFNIETQFTLGISLALLSAFLAALFTALNALYIKEHNATKITTYEMAGGFVGLCIYLIVSGGFDGNNFVPTPTDWIYILVLGLVCTAYAFVVSVDIMKEISPFTVAISVNLEPIYAIILALIIFGEEEHMSPGFYLGAFILISTILANAMVKKMQKRKLNTVQ